MLRLNIFALLGAKNIYRDKINCDILEENNMLTITISQSASSMLFLVSRLFKRAEALFFTNSL